MGETFMTMIKSKERLCFMAFGLALCAIFEGFIFHAAEFAERHHLIPAAYASESEKK